MSGGEYNVRWVASASQIDAGLWQTCFRPPVEGLWWYETLEGSKLNDQFTFSYGVISDRDTEIGIAPVFLFDMPLAEVAPKTLLKTLEQIGRVIPSLLYQRTVFVGSPCVSEGTVGLRPSANRHQALIALYDALHRKARADKASLVIWKDIPASFGEDFARLRQTRRLFRTASFPGTIADIPRGKKQEFFASLKGSRRHNLKKKIKKSTASVNVTVEIVKTPNPETLDDIFKLFTQTYEKSNNKFERLTKTFFEIIAEKEETSFLILREAQSLEMIAFMLYFDMGEMLVNKFIGMDYSRPKDWLLYFRLWDAALDLAVSHGYRTIESGQLSYPIKIEMGHRLQPLTNYCFHRKPIMHCIYALAARATVSLNSLDNGLSTYLKAHPEVLAELEAASPSGSL